jgi:hypothetical protein
MTVRIEEHQAGLRAGNAEFDPALLRIGFTWERLIGQNDEAEFPGVELESGVLITYGNRCNLMDLIMAEVCWKSVGDATWFSPLC